MDRCGGTIMELHFVTDDKIAETSSKGNQEKWYDNDTDRWYKLDQFGYEAQVGPRYDLMGSEYGL